MIRSTLIDDAPAIEAILAHSGAFDRDGLAHVRATLEHDLAQQSDAIWLTALEGVPVGVAYVAPEPLAHATWNLRMIWTRHDKSGAGYGRQLIERIDAELRVRHARLLIVETSGLPTFAAARAFYTKVGFEHEATIRDFFAAGDDKLVFTKRLSSAPAG